MNKDFFKKEGKKGYNKDEVDAFIEDLNKIHLENIFEKDAEIKEYYAKSEEKNLKINTLQNEIETLKIKIASLEAKKDDEAIQLNARIGEKLSAAEDAAKNIIDSAKNESYDILLSTRKETEKLILEAKERIAKYCEKACKIADIYEEKQHLVSSGIEQARRHLGEAAINVEKIISDLFK